MFVILGATGHVGTACVHQLRRGGHPVLALVHHDGSGEELRAAGAETLVIDVCDSDALRGAFRRGRRALLLNPPGDVSGDTDAIETAQVRAIIAALDGSGLEKIVVESTMGAMPGEAIGDLTVLWKLEEGARASGIPTSVQRGAYYYSNWDLQLDAIREQGVLTTMIPADMAIPMVSPADLGRVAAQLLVAPPEQARTVATQGPRLYSPNDVAAIFAERLGRPVRVSEVPRDRWRAAFIAQGFSEAAADAYTRMTEVSADRRFAGDDDDPQLGEIRLEDHIAMLLAGR